MRLLVPAAGAALIATAAMSLAALSVPAVRASALPASAPPASAPPASALPASALPASALPASALPASALPASALPVRFIWPLAPRPAVHRRFEPPRDRYSRGHRGVDVAAKAGQPVLSAGEGVIAYSGVIAGRGVVTVRHSGALRTTYEPVERRAPFGMRVHGGAPIGVVSPTPGHCIPLTCLHWGAISVTTYLDPLSLLGLRRPILLPLG
jgi:murein DD-endopeptidase MepM/ murein hydrolase activator NlpD